MMATFTLLVIIGEIICLAILSNIMESDTVNCYLLTVISMLFYPFPL